MAAQHLGPPTTPELLDAADLSLDTWTPGARESAVFARLLADARGWRPAGRVTDRLGLTGEPGRGPVTAGRAAPLPRA
ncbi:hypothetical protein [Streptomyces sp. JW3]|uniref:hypothetical protein n=1 Tax=Streptomyces sp. JW3 TaxID=3456955 RepID=UPI003FA4B776